MDIGDLFCLSRTFDCSIEGMDSMLDVHFFGDCPCHDKDIDAVIPMSHVKVMIGICPSRATIYPHKQVNELALTRQDRVE
jgi:hypothetical protein